MRKYYVYEWYNVDTGEVFYVGKGTKRRYRTKKGRNPYFQHYVNKHKCKSRIKFNNLTEDEAYQKEIELIAYYRSIGQAYCNLTEGGENPPTMFGEDNPISRSVVQLTLEGKLVKIWESINQAAESLKVSDGSISSCCKRKYGRKSCAGFLWVYKENYDPKKKYGYNPENNSRPIVQFDINGDFIREWSSAIEIEKELGYLRSGICGVCKGYYRTAHGYIWRYKDDVGDAKHIEVKNKGKSPIPVVQLDLQGNYIATFENCAEAARSIGVKTNSHIVSCCNKKRKTASGYKWMYEHEYRKQLEDYKNPLFV